MIRMRVVTNRFAEIGAAIGPRATVLVDETVAALGERLAATLPVGPTGDLHTDITVIPAHRAGAGQRAGIELEPYWHFVEFGTHRQAAQPRVIPAVELLRSTFVAGAQHLIAAP